MRALPIRWQMRSGPEVMLILKYARKYAGYPIVRRARRLARSFLDRTAHADDLQRDRLLHLIRRHADSQFGRDHHFAEIQSIEDYRKRVPIRGYDGHEPYIRQVREGRPEALFGSGTEVLMFAKTSGTTAEPKTIPITRESLQNYRDGWTIWGVQAFDAHYGMIRWGMRPILQMVSDWKESFTAAGIPCGAITGLTAQMQNPLVRLNYCMTPATARIKEIESKYYAALRLSVHRDLGALMAANPSTMLAIARLGDREKASLIRDIADGTIDPRWEIPTDVREAMKIRTRWKRVKTARRLEKIVHDTGGLWPRDYWPNLEFLANWTGGTMGAYLRSIPEVFGDRPIRDVGLIASEGRMTIPIDDHTPSGLIDYWHQYFEFIPEDQADKEQPDTLNAWELREGERYFILLTTAGGLHRYNIFDLVRCTGFLGKAPLIEFLNKGAHFSSLTGEKLSEYQVVQAVNQATHNLDLRLAGYVLLARWGDPPYYELLVEQTDLGESNLARRLESEVDERLGKVNLEYENRRETLRLGPSRVRAVAPGTWLEFKKRRLERSRGTAEQYKQPCLLADLDAWESYGFRDALPERSDLVGNGVDHSG